MMSMIGRSDLENKLDALQRSTEHVIGYDFDTTGYVAINLTAPMNSYMIPIRMAEMLTLSAIQTLINKHTKQELK